MQRGSRIPFQRGFTLVELLVAMAVMAAPLMGYMDAAAQALYNPAGYINDVLAAPVVVSEVTP